MPNFAYPKPPDPSKVWWERPAYWSRYGDGHGNLVSEWRCAFCPHKEESLDHYGKIGYTCPNCGAAFMDKNVLGVWMAKEVDEAWAKDRKEVWG